MHVAIRPYVISGIAIASAGVLVALPATTPQLTAPPDVRIAASQEPPTLNPLLATSLPSAQPSITAVPDLSAASIAESTEELLGAIAIISEATGVAIEEVVMALGNVPSMFFGALEDLASGESPADVLRNVGVRITINIRNVFVFPLRTLQGLPAPFGGTGGLFDQMEEFIIAFTNTIIDFLQPPIAMSAAEAGFSAAAGDTADVTVAQGDAVASGPTDDDSAGTERQATVDALDNSGEGLAAAQDADTAAVTGDGAVEVEPAAAPGPASDDTEKANGATDLTDGNLAEPGKDKAEVDGEGRDDATATTEAVDSETSGSETKSTGENESSE